MEVFYYASFLRQLKKLPKIVREAATRQTKLFMKDPHDPRLRLHKLHGRLVGYSAFHVDFKIRIVLEVKSGKAYFHSIGDHGVYDE